MKACRASWLALMAALAVGPGAKGSPERVADPLADAGALVSAHPGLRVMRVQGESMVPFFTDGAVVVVKTIPVSRLLPGMVVVYRNRFGEMIAHRVLAAMAGGWKVKGQANDTPDSTLVTERNLIGVVYAVFNAPPPATPALAAVEVALAAPAR
ncbi:MAG: signal peptidase I [Pseudomonadota bacterium]